MTKNWRLVPWLSWFALGCSGATEHPSAPFSRDTGVLLGTDGGTTERDFSGLAINEIAAQGAPNDWVELYNGSDQVIDLSELGYTDSPTVTPARAFFARGATIAAHGYVVVDLTDQSPGFKLGSDEAFGIFAPNGALIDSTDWAEGASPAGQSWGRVPDGIGSFRTLSEPTRGASNAERTLVVINELSSAGNDPIELAHRGGPPLDLGGWYIGDSAYDPLDASTNSHRFTLPSGRRLEVGSYLVLEKGVDHAFGLGAADTVRLYSPDGQLVDEVSWPASAAEPSYCRRPDGSGAFSTCPTTSFGQPNPP